MTPFQLAQAECANYEHNGACLGLHIGDNGETTGCSPKPGCVVSVGERCAYFEECVAPMADMARAMKFSGSSSRILSIRP